MKVYKFGGSSLAKADRIKQVSEIIINGAKDQKILAVFSAFGKTTDNLLNSAVLAAQGNDDYLEIIQDLEQYHLNIVRDLFTNHGQLEAFVKMNFEEINNILEGVYHLREFSDRTYDRLLSEGELMSSYIIAEYLKTLNSSVQWVDSREVIKTENYHKGARILIKETFSNIKQLDLDTQITVFPGFISTTIDNEPTTLGRGGSDYTAALLTSGRKATELVVWKDVDGMLTADPTKVETAKLIQEMSYEEALELSHFGAKVLYPPTVQALITKKIPIRIKNTFYPDNEGTLITYKEKIKHPVKVRGVSSINDVSLITISGGEMFGLVGFSKRFFETFNKERINLIMITQASSEHAITVAILPEDTYKALKALNTEFEWEISQNRLDPVQVEDNLSILALVGIGMKNYPGISGKMFETLGKNGVNVRAIAQGSTETNITCVISKSDLVKALNVINETFFDKEIKQINLFVAGVGNVGGKLLEQIKSQQDYLLEKQLLRINVCGLSNSKKMLFDKTGIDLNTWKERLEKEGTTADINEFKEKVIALNIRNSIFVDNSANPEIASTYEYFLEHNVGVVTCNKIAASDKLSRYKNLKQLAVEHNTPYLYETNVGAGLPIIGTLKSLIDSGDNIRSIKAVLSGSLNFIFNNFKEGVEFIDVVKQAMAEGYTEPDPRIDLSGVDVMRKILILSRESGLDLEMTDIAQNGFLDEKYMQGSVDEFLQLLKDNSEYFNQLYKAAADKNCQLKFVASLENGKAAVGLQEIPEGHPFYNLEGKDNIVMLLTDRYPEQPMIIKGAGAGADVTAMGVFSDIIRFARI